MIKERVIQILEFKDVPKESFYTKIGMTSASFRGKARNTPLNSTAIENILTILPDVNPEWLITGKGEMLLKKPTLVEEPTALYNLSKQDNKLIPLYDISATAGATPLFSDNGRFIPTSYINVPNAPKCDGAVFVVGDSMYPLLKSGDIVAYKLVNDIQNGIFYGEKYIVSLNFDDDEYITIKYIQRSDIPNHIKLVSHNQHHSPKDVPISSIRSLALVKLSIRYETIQ